MLPRFSCRSILFLLSDWFNHDFSPDLWLLVHQRPVEFSPTPCLSDRTSGSGEMISPLGKLLSLTMQVAILIYPCTPESPRWLVSKGKIEQARQVIARYQTTSEDVNSPVVSAQIEQIQASLETLHVKAWDYSVFWKSPSGRYRIWIIILYSFFQQWNGGGLLYSYLPGILEMVGVETAQAQLGISLGMSCSLISILKRQPI